MTRLEDRQHLTVLIEEARAAGSRLAPACEAVGIDERTYQRWHREGRLAPDRRPVAKRPRPKNALSAEERKQVLSIANEPRFAELPPSQIVPRLADEGRYVASESTFYRVLRQHRQNAHRGRAKAPRPQEFSIFKSCSVHCMMSLLGITPSYSRPRVSNDNPFIESVFRTTKYHPMYPETPFASIRDARIWADAFVTWYNTKHRHSGIRFVTPHERHTGQDRHILAARTQVYEAARRAHPERWSGPIRNWQPILSVTLNPERERPVATFSLPDRRLAHVA